MSLGINVNGVYMTEEDIEKAYQEIQRIKKIPQPNPQQIAGARVCVRMSAGEIFLQIGLFDENMFSRRERKELFEYIKLIDEYDDLINGKK